MAGSFALATVDVWPAWSVLLTACARRTQPHEAMEHGTCTTRSQHILAARHMTGPLSAPRDAHMRTPHAYCTETTLTPPLRGSPRAHSDQNVVQRHASAHTQSARCALLVLLAAADSRPMATSGRRRHRGDH